MYNFNSYDHNFCESSIYSNEPHPEYMNSLSSLFITFIGINGIIKPNTNFLLSLLYSSFIVNGITSSFYHYYNTLGWGLLDRMSMILISMSSIYLFIYNINNILILYRSNYIYKSNKIKSINNIKFINFIRFINIIIKILVTLYFTILFTVAGLHMETLFNILFGVFLCSLIIFMYLISRHHTVLNVPYFLILLGWKGIKYITISGIFWIATENLCYEYNFIKYLYGHVWWHLFVSYGGYLISLIPCYLYMIEIQSRNMLPIILTYDTFNIPYLVFDSSHNSHTNIV